ncbi:MAG TPA: ABC transporter ATP-binding protein [Polyangiaceae bacterium]|nr:ABC transporter ATP-binding protein [Polyangiaceae bacterium]
MTAASPMRISRSATSGDARSTSSRDRVSAPPELCATGIDKRFGAFVALEGVSLTLRPGSFHALLGENGAGKSTLVKCIMGYYRPDGGRILLDGTEVSIRSPRDAQQHGIGMVYQHFTVVPNMTVAENLVLARSDLPFLLDWTHIERELSAFMKRMPFCLDLSRQVRSLSAGEKQKLEILKQLYLGSRIMILDEPTSVLTPAEADEVLGFLREMAGRGELSVLLITHKFREVTNFAEEVTILRRGRLAGSGRVDALGAEDMARMMVGGQPPQADRRRSVRPVGDRYLVLEKLEAVDEKGITVLRGLDLEVRAGEIVGIAGVSGNGQEPLVEVLAGQRQAKSGVMTVRGAAYRATRSEMLVHGLRFLPEEPLRNACVPTMSVADNLGFGSYDRPPFTVARFGVRSGALRRTAARLVSEFRVKTPSVDAAIGRLSGGNVQRTVLARALTGDVHVLVAANPCFGLDFAAVAEIRTRLLNARDLGMAVLLISTDLDEIFALADRILVMSEGKIVHESPIATADVTTIGRCMAGHGHA